MTDEKKLSAIASLKAKLQSLAPSAANTTSALVVLSEGLQGVKHPTAIPLGEGVVALAGAKYVHVGINKNWDPKDHPRDPHTGEFMETPGGFIFGKAKKATFKGLGTEIEFDLAPGDVVFQTQAKNYIVSHADGSYSLHNGKKNLEIPAGSYNQIAEMSEKGALQKVAENPGTVVKAKTEAEAAKKISSPDSFEKQAPVVSQQIPATVDTLSPVPEKKAGKSAFTAKQYKDYQEANAGKTLFNDANGTPVTSGSWIDVGGKPMQVHASPEGHGKLSVYRWVATKQQASNLVKEDFLSPEDLDKAVAISDPTGKPYGDTGVSAGDIKAAAKGSLMSQAVSGGVPTTSTAYKNHALGSVGDPIDGTGVSAGDWVEIEGKPWKVYASPNDGHVALAKWVSTKQQASNNMYDFPVSVLDGLQPIDNPEGKPYVFAKKPVKAKPSPEETDTKPASEVISEILEKSPDADPVEVSDEEYESAVSYLKGKLEEDLPEPEPETTLMNTVYPVPELPKGAEGKTLEYSVAGGLVFYNQKGLWKTYGGASPTATEASVLDEKYLKIANVANDVYDAPEGTHIYASEVSGKISSFTKTSDGWQSAGATDYSSAMPLEDVLEVLISKHLLTEFSITTPDIHAPDPDFPHPDDQPNTPDVDADKPHTPAGKFVHPVSGAIFEIPEGSKVYKHHATDNWIIQTTDPDNPINFFTSNGKLQKPKKVHKGFQAYVLQKEWPGSSEKDTDPAAGVTAKDALPGDQLHFPGTDGNPVHVTKQSTGMWLWSSTGAFSTEMGVQSLLDGVPGFTVTGFVPHALTDFLEPEDTGESPWGAPEVSYEEPAKPVAKKTPAPKKKKSGNGTDYTFPNGTTLHIAPGEALVKVSSAGTTYFLHVTMGSGKTSVKYHNVGYTEDGSPHSLLWSEAENFTFNNVKSKIKDYPSHELVEYNSLDTKNLGKGGDTEPSTIPENWDALGVVRKPHYNSPLTPVIQPTNGAQLSFATVAVARFGTSSGKPPELIWHGAPGELFSSLAESAPAYRELLGHLRAYEAKFTKEDPDSIPESLASHFQLLEALHDISRLAQDVADPDSGLDESEIENRVSFYVGKLTTSAGSKSVLGPSHKMVTAEILASALQAGLAARKFKKSQESLGFNPYDTTPENYAAFGKEKGQPNLHLLDPEDQKAWTLATLGAPGTKLSDAADLNAKVENQIAAAKVAAMAQAAIANPSQKPFPDPYAGESGSWAHVTSAMSLEKKYEISNPAITLTFESPDSWFCEGEQGSVTLGDTSVLAMVNTALASGSDVKVSGGKAYGNSEETFEEKLEAFQEKTFQHTWDEGTELYSDPFKFQSVRLLFTEETGIQLESPSVLLANRLTHWAEAKASGNHLVAFSIEQKLLGSNPAPESHHISPGNPQSPLGKAAYTALAAKLKSTSEGTKYLSGESLTATEKQKIRDEFGFPTSKDLRWGLPSPETIQPFAVSNPKPLDAPEMTGKPEVVPDGIWALVKSFDSAPEGISELTDLAPVAHKSPAEMIAKLQGVPSLAGPHLASLPESHLQLAYWAKLKHDAGGGSGNLDYWHILTALTARAKAGDYLQDSTPVWTAPNGDKYAVSPGSKIVEKKGGKWVFGPEGSQFLWTTHGVEPYDPNAYYAPKDLEGGVEFSVGAPVSWEQAAKENPQFAENVWNQISTLESEVSVSDPATLATAKGSPALKDFPAIAKNLSTLPSSVLAGVAHSLGSPNNPWDSAFLKQVEYKAAKGHYSSLLKADLFAAESPWNTHLSKGQFEKITDWSTEAQLGYMQKFGLSSPDQILPDLNNRLFPNNNVKPLPIGWGNQPDLSTIKFTKSGKSLGGMHSKHHLYDADGNEWMQKTFQSDPSMAEYRIDAEVGALQIGNLHGFRGPLAFAVNLSNGFNGGGSVMAPGEGGQYAYVQHLKGGKGTTDLVGFGPNDLTDKQLAQAMEEHVLDWILANHDSHKENLRFDDDGNVFGIDKGQAFKHFPNDKLAVGYLPPENGAPVWYDLVYKAIQNGTLTKDRADAMVISVLKKAQTISKSKDEQHRELLEKALAKRPNWPSQFSTKEAFIDALMERKRNVADDFSEFFENLYKGSPYSWDISPDNLTTDKIGEGKSAVYVAPTTEFLQEVQKSGTHGKALFFSSDYIEDAHILFSKASVENSSEKLLVGKTKLSEAGDAVLTEWLSKQTVDKQGHSSVPSDPTLPLPFASLPGNETLFETMVKYSKTVSHHNGSGDTDYNQGTLDSAKQANEAVQQVLGALEKHTGDDLFTLEVGSPASTFFGTSTIEMHTASQQASFKEMLETYKGYYVTVKGKEGTSEKVSPHFTKYDYVPSKDSFKEYAAKAGVPASLAEVQGLDEGAAFQQKGSEVVYTKTGSGWAYSGTGSISDASFLKLLEGTEFEPYKSPDSSDISNTVMVGSQKVKVSYKTATSLWGSMDKESGFSTYQSASPDKSAFVDGSQKMYEIEFGNTRITYRPYASEHGVGMAQKGDLSITQRHFSDDDTVHVGEALDLLRQMGVDLGPADETSLEATYWKRLTQDLLDRSDKNSYGGANADDLENLLFDTSVNSPEVELEKYRDLWKKILGDKWREPDYLPKQKVSSLHSLDTSSGRPYWSHPDETVESAKALREFYKGKIPALSTISYKSDLSGNVPESAYLMAITGVSASTEERYRILSKEFSSGMSSEEDVAYGGSGFVFIRQGWGAKNSYFDSAVIYSPSVHFRAQNYSYDSDMWGKASFKHQSVFDPLEAAKKTSNQGSNELMVKNSVSVLEDMAAIAFKTVAERDKTIAFYQSKGITEIHGLPLDQFFLLSSNKVGIEAANERAWDRYIAELEEKEANNG